MDNGVDSVTDVHSLEDGFDRIKSLQLLVIISLSHKIYINTIYEN